MLFVGISGEWISIFVGPWIEISYIIIQFSFAFCSPQCPRAEPWKKCLRNLCAKLSMDQANFVLVQTSWEPESLRAAIFWGLVSWKSMQLLLQNGKTKNLKRQGALSRSRGRHIAVACSRKLEARLATTKHHDMGLEDFGRWFSVCKCMCIYIYICE